MQINYRIFNSWLDLESRSDAGDFIYYQTSTGKKIALDYHEMCKLNSLYSKKKFLEVTALIISELGKALEADKLSGAITLTDD